MRWSSSDSHDAPAVAVGGRRPARAVLCALALALALAACGPRAGAPDLAPERASEAGEDRTLVVLVHGMGRTPLSMLGLARSLEREGYAVLNWGYSSTCCSVAELAARLAEDVREHGGGRFARVHLVTHSLGGVIARSMLARGGDAGLRVERVVMLAPPNQGSHEADRFAPWLGWLLQPLEELRTHPASTVRTLPPLRAGTRVGVIAGRDDGKVSVAETYLPGQAAHCVVAGAHSFLMFRKDVQRLASEFLRTGAFGREADRCLDGGSEAAVSDAEGSPLPRSEAFERVR